MGYEKVQQGINNIVGDNVKKIAQLFPSVVKDGEIDFETLKEELGQFSEVSSEKYELTWAGKKNAKKIAQEDILGRTLKYISEDSKDANTTENLYIEGDNLEILKLIRQNYYSSIKMIYIDPPYNTGNDFVYNDSFTMTEYESAIAEGNMDELGQRYRLNNKSQNRFHASWLNMMYPRLKVAKDILADDGVIFMSIDDNEIDNARKIMSELFGEDNLIAQFTVASNSAKNNSKYVSISHEYLLCYGKNKEGLPIDWAVARNNIEEFKKRALGLLKSGLSNEEIHSELLALVKYPRFFEFDHYTYVDARGPFRASDLTAPGSKNYYDVLHPATGKPCKKGTRGWAYSEENLSELIKEDRILFGEDEFVMPQLKNYLFENEKTLPKSVLFFDSQSSTKWMKSNMFEFDFPKSIELIQLIISMYPSDNFTIMDFFSGSATTAHAIMQLNAIDHGKRKYIMVQLPECINKESMTNEKRYKNICEIGKERIRRAGTKIKEDNPEFSVDVGFKVFRVDDSNIKWNSLIDAGQLDINQLEMTPDLADFMPGTNDIDVVYELMLRQRDVTLSEKLEKVVNIGRRTYLYASSYLVCLETDITIEIVDKLAAIDPLPVKFIFRDSAFRDDIALKDETFRRLKALIEKNSGTTKQSYTVEFI